MWVAGDTGTKLIDNHLIGYFRFLFLFVRNRNKISGNIKESSIERIYPNYDLFLWYLNEQSQGTSWWSVLVGARKWQVSMRNYILVFGYIWYSFGGFIQIQLHASVWRFLKPLKVLAFCVSLDYNLNTDCVDWETEHLQALTLSFFTLNIFQYSWRKILI